MNSKQLADAANIQSISENQGSGVRTNGRAPNTGDDCCINGVGSRAKELLDQVPPCTGK